MSKPRTGAPKRVAVGLLAGALAMFGVALAPSAGASASVTTERLAGTTRYGTAAAIAGSTTFATPTTAIVATGENFPDALAASTLAGANTQAPIVLTQSATYTADAKAALAALKAKGVTALTIVGGTSAVSTAVETAIKADGFTVTRVAGDNRYATAAAIATAANTKSAPAAIGGLKTALIATGVNFPDALAGGPAAYANKLPLLLVNDTVPAETAAAITALGIKKVVILGGTAAVSTTVEAGLVAATGNPATRLAGTNRYGTAASVLDYEKGTLAFPITSAVLATGVNFPDALASGPLAGQNKAPIILTASLPAESQKALDDNSATIGKLWVSGGTTAIDDATVTAAKTAAQNVSNDSAAKAVTTRPELTGASIVATTTALQQTPTLAAGTTVRYTFDEALSPAFGTNAGMFHVYAADYGTAGTTVLSGNTATIESTSTPANTTVIVNFPTLNTAASAANLTKATVDFGGVKDVGGAENPEGSASIGTAGSTVTPAGTTAAADLKSVSGFRQGVTAGTTAVDFVFDQVAYAASQTGFHLVLPNSTDVACSGPATASDVTPGIPGTSTSAGGNGTTTITVVCNNQGGATGPLYSASTVARAYVPAGAVTTTVAGANASPLEAVALTITTTTPDLLSVQLAAGTTGGMDSALFTFDKSVAVATAQNFRLYTTAGTEVTPTAYVCTLASAAADAATSSTSGCAINASNPTQVTIRVPLNTVASVVGGDVRGDGTANNSAVFGLQGANLPDSRQAGNTATVTTQPGKTAGPDLSSVVMAATTDAFGNANGFAATYTFDLGMNAGATQVASKFHLYLSDGTRFTAGTCTASSTAPTSVTCTGFVNALTSLPPTVASTVGGSVLGTVQNAAVTSSTATGSLVNTEDAAATTGGTGTSAS